MGCVIMASGLSRRFGGNKLLADFKGEPMFVRILAATEGLFDRRAVITRHPEIAEICRARGIDAVLHDLPYRSDQPLLKRETVAALLAAARQDRGSIWRPCFEDAPGAPVLFPAWAFDELKHLPEGKGGGYIAKQYPQRVRMIQVANQYELMDADDRETLLLLLSAE